MSVKQVPFGQLGDGRDVPAFVITNTNGLSVKVSAYGAAVVSVDARDADGNVADIVLGFDDVSGYEKDPHYIGVTIGRMANRIGNSHFQISGKRVVLPTNEGTTHLHGGMHGFHRQLWDPEIVDGQSVRMSLVSRDGDQGYPGNLSAEVLFTWTDENELNLEYRATTDQPTVCDLTNHSYFNLAGQGDTLDHLLTINSDERLLINDDFVPTGEVSNVWNSVYDYRQSRPIRDYTVGQEGGHGEYYVLKTSGEPELAVRAVDPVSKRSVECYTDQSMLVFYEGYFVGGEGKGEQTYSRHSGFCIETQNHVNAVNITDFPSPFLNPGQEYRHMCMYKFGVDG